MYGDRYRLLTLFSTFLVLTISIAVIAAAQSLDIVPEKGVEHPKIESVLTELQIEYEKSLVAAQRFAHERGIKVKVRDKVTVFLISEAGKTVDAIDKTSLETFGTEIIKSGDNVLKAVVPINLLNQIADNVKGIAYIKLPDEPLPLAYQSEGVSLTGASAYHSAGYTGLGVKVAIIDLGFAGLSSAISNGDLPSSVIKIDCTGTSCVSTTYPSETETHGAGVSEVVYDMAPGAQLYLIKVADPLDLKDAKDYCINNGIKIINHSVGWVNTNFYSGECYNDNPVCSVENAYSNGILWVNSMGNAAKMHYEGTFTDSDSDGWHEVSIGDETINIFADSGETIKVFLTWDAWPTTNQDYNLYLYDSFLNEVASSTNYQTGTQPPTEAIFYSVPSTGTYHLAIRKFSATSNHKLEIYSFNHNLTPAIASSSLTNPADATNAMAVAAIFHGNWTTGPQESYSSQGPANDGFIKPDISGPDGVSNYTYYSTGFYGTSAASPHVAGAAALILSANPSYSVSQLWNLLTGSTIDMGSTGQDNIYGYGRLNLPDITPPTVGAFSVTPNSLALSNAFTISYTVSDTGGSGLNRAELWRANDSGGSPVGWSEIKRTYLSGNGHISGSFSDIPPSKGVYWYEIHVVDNAANSSTQPSPPGPIKVTVTGPDLTGTWTSLTHTCKNTKKGIKCKVKSKLNIQNIGNQDALSSFVRYYLSDDNTFGEGDIFLKQVATGKIKKGKSKDRTLSYSFPLGVTVSGKYIIAVIDADNTVVEANETNNNITYGPIP